jgi:AP endonuclease 2
MKEKVELDGKEVHLLDIMNPPGMFENGKRLRKWNAKDMPALSGRLIPEFAQRRNIRDMFSKRPSAASSNGNGTTLTPATQASTPPPASMPPSVIRSPVLEKANVPSKAASKL